MSTVAIHTFHHLAMILEANDKDPLCSEEMSGQIWAPTVPRGNILPRHRERGCWLTEASALHTLPPLWPPPLHSIWFMHAHGLSWPVASSKPLSAGLYSKRTWPQIPRPNQQANRWMVAEPSPLSLPSFLFLPPAWPHKAGHGCTAYTHTKSFSLSPFIYQMEPYHMVLIGCN